MPSTAQQIRGYRGPAVLSIGFRPFFLAGATWAGLATLAWPAVLLGRLHLPTVLSPVEWHAHELLFGAIPAIVAGFLLTAIPNWTGRLPVTGKPLLGLLLIWLAGRAAVGLSSLIGAVPAAAIDILFLLALLVVVAREIIAGSNYRNLGVAAVLSLLVAANVVFHARVIGDGDTSPAARGAVAAFILLIMLFGGRLAPSFTRNWLVKRGETRLPVPFGPFDVVAMATAAAALLAWLAAPEYRVTALVAAVAGVLQFARLARWQGYRTLAEPLVAILHAGYFFIPLGFVLVAIAAANPALLPPSTAMHAWTAGAIGTMTLAVMTRASLGHTGHDLHAGAITQAIYAAVLTGTLARLLLPFAGSAYEPVLHTASLLWAAGFLGFALTYGPILARPRRAAA
ncbi:MAG TPA: NnrS family protein [Hyphomicrobiaceae bacterium]|nr:NnrS family protein [Hyphomicrobiaceae bacterium]